MAGKWILISVAAVLAGAGAAALSVHWKGRPASPPRPSGAALISSTAEITLSGNLRPQHVTTVKADVDGNLDAFLVDIGDEVFEGEPLARIGASALESQREAAAAATNAEGHVARAEQSVATARLEASRAEADRQRSQSALDKQRVNYERQQTLNRSGATPRLTWEKAQHDYQLAQQDFELMDKASRLSAEQVQSALNALTEAKANLLQPNQELEAAQSHMQAAEVKSPVNGTVVARNGETGKPAPADVLTIATDLYALEVALDPRPDVLPRLHPGQAALVLIPDLQSAGIPGDVKEIKDNQAIVEFNCPLPAVRPGMRVDVRLKLE